MKLGLQTISWGGQLSDIKEVIATASELGLSGLELAQRVEMIGTLEHLRDMLTASGIRVVGLAGGGIRSRLHSARVLEAEYLYADEWDEEGIRDAMDQDITVAVHPHLYKGIDSVRTAEFYLARYPKLRMILDTAHCFLAGDDVVEAFKRNQHKVVTVHLKDWMASYGRSPHHFARGFTALGTGELHDLLDKMIIELKNSKFTGWVIIEQDTPHGFPAKCASISRTWLKERGI